MMNFPVDRCQDVRQDDDDDDDDMTMMTMTSKTTILLPNITIYFFQVISFDIKLLLQVTVNCISNKEPPISPFITQECMDTI